MPDSPNKLSQFWQELKRRRVVQVIVVYASAAFVIIELINNVTEPLNLPDWTPTLIIIMLLVGFPIALIFSWIFDVTPEGLEKTKPAKEVKPGEKTVTPNSWKIASLISALVIVILIVLNIIPRLGNNEILDKSIAVLPFRNDSPDQENDYFINGTMESILNNLCKIGDLRVISRSSVEQYRDSIVYIPEVAEFLNVSYILEGSMQKYGNRIRMTLQLIDRHDKHVWSEQYDREILTVEENLSLQSEIAELVARGLQVVITPEEKQRIVKIPTTNSLAYEFYQRGMNEYLNSNNLEEVLRNAENLFRYALEYDSTFAQAYVGLAQVYWSQHFLETYFSENFLDSTLSLLDVALSYDDQLSDAYSVRGDYYREIGMHEQAVKEYEKAIQLNPNDWSAYNGLGSIYRRVLEDYIKALDNMQEALIRNRGEQLPQLLRGLAYTYLEVGFKGKAENFFQEKLILDGDSVDYLTGLAWMEFSLGDFQNAVEIQRRAYQMDTSRLRINNTLILYYSIAGQDKEAYMYAEKYNKWIAENAGLSLQQTYRSAYAYKQVGKDKEAEILFNRQIKYDTEALELGRDLSRFGAAHYDLAAVYAFLGTKAKAYEYLREFIKKNTYPLWWVTLIKNDPLFDNIKDEPEFQQIVRDVEAKYQAEHERVRKWLDENDML